MSAETSHGTPTLTARFDAMQTPAEVLDWLRDSRRCWHAEWPRGGGLDQALQAARGCRHGPALAAELDALAGSEPSPGSLRR